jgi:heterotetrameric sarcosine oxidase gamma subunit
MRVSALGAWTEASGDGLKLAERRGLAVIELAAFSRSESIRQDLSRTLGLPLPAAGASAETSGVAVLSIGPGRWLLLGAEAAMASLSHLSEEQAAVTDLTGGRTILTLTGAHAVPTLMKGTAVDLDPAMFAAGSVAATALAHMPAIIWRRGESYDVIIPRSYAVSLLEWMLEAGGLA